MDSTLNLRGTEPTALITLSSALERALTLNGATDRSVVFACIGTDRSTGDALGPLVGQRLRRLGCPAESVIGTLEEPLHALNLAERLGPLATADPRPLVIAVDAALGASANVGTITLRPGGLKPGQGVGKALPEVGELSITATVNVSAGALDAQVLQSTRLFMVQELAETIGTACWWALRMVRRGDTARTGRAAVTAIAA
jgi:putative sporulation protein YyaC